ncbi:MAG: type I methionyl aminopeptidase [Candidatus Moranbacteria bacterium]|nr:type I methionyl aminopeptidase [Candidatus Moranbacteria bacterium]
MNDSIKRDDELESLRESGLRLAGIMSEIPSLAVPGVSTKTIGDRIEEMIRKEGGVPIFKGYGAESGRPFPAAACVSLNDEVVHGIPSSGRILREGDLLKIDMGMRFHGMVSDMARTFPVGAVSADAKKLLETTKESLDRGISKIRSGARLSDFAHAVQSHVEGRGYSVVRDLVGHGVGRELHEDPQIPNYFLKGMDNFSFRKGMSVALEPMVNAGHFAIRVAPDGWTYLTKDGSLSAHFEDTVIVTERGAEIVTRIQ